MIISKLWAFLKSKDNQEAIKIVLAILGGLAAALAYFKPFPSDLTNLPISQNSVVPGNIKQESNKSVNTGDINNSDVKINQ